MSIPLLICDDSNMARKQVARSLPDDWDVEISFATNGEEGIQAIKAGKAEYPNGCLKPLRKVPRPFDGLSKLVLKAF